MPIELLLLVWSPVLLALYLVPQAILYRLEYGVRFAASGRDSEPPASSRYLQRSDKALRNFLETYGVFVALAAASALIPRSDVLTQWGSILWFGARIAYVPLYFFAVRYVRSLAWCLVAAGLAMMFFGVAF